MQGTYISFYLRTNRIHLFVDSLRAIGSPKYFCFMLQENGQALAIVPYDKKDLKSHWVPPTVYTGTKDMEVNSMRLCRIISEMHHWTPGGSYRVPGFVLEDRSAAIFMLSKAKLIDKSAE